MSSNQARQAQRDAANQAAADAARRAEQQSGGGIYQPTPTRSAPTNIDLSTPAGQALRKYYEQSGVVFDDQGRILYNPADLGANEVERARARSGLPPSYQERGEPSPQYVESVRRAGGDARALRSQTAKLNTIRTAKSDEIGQVEDAIKSNQQQLDTLRNQRRPEGSEIQEYEGKYQALRAEQQSLYSRRDTLKTQLKSIDTARTEAAIAERQATTQQTRSAFLDMSGRTTAGPVNTGMLTNSRAYQPTETASATPQRQRPVAITGVKEKLFANPSFVTLDQQQAIDQRNATRAAFAGITNKPGQPQRQRAKAQQGVKEKLYANPNFVTPAQQLDQGISQVSGAMTNKSYQVNLNESPQLYNLEINGQTLEGLTGQQVAEYQKTFELGKKLYEFKQAEFQKQLKDYQSELQKNNVEQVPLVVNGQTIFVKTEKLTSEFNRAIAKDPNARISGFIGLEENLKISNPEMGPTKIQQSPTGQTTTTISKLRPVPPAPPSPYPFIPLSLKDGELTGIGTYQGQPSLITLNTKPAFEPVETTSPVNEIDKLTMYAEKNAEKLQREGPAGQFAAELIRNVSGVFPGFVNLATTYITKPTAQLLTQSTIASPQALTVPKELTGVGISGLGVTAEKLVPLTPLAPILKGPTVKPINATATLQEAGQTFNEEFVQPTQQYVNERGLMTVPAAILGGILTGGGLGVEGKVVRVVPLRYGAIPIYTAKGDVTVQRALAVGYDTVNKPVIGKYGPYGGGKFFVGKANPVKLGVEAIEAPTGSSFDRFQPSNFTPFQQSLFKPMMKYAEEKGLTRPGFIEEVEPTLKNEMVRQRNQVPFEYEKTFPNQVLEPLPAGAPTYNIAESIGQSQKAKELEAVKGSIVQRLLKGGLSRPLGDIDVEATSTAKGENAVQRILKTDVGPNKALEREGYNISIGDIDYDRGFFDAKLARNELAHGTDLQSARKIMRYGADPNERPYGMPAFFVTEDSSIFTNFASGGKNPRVVIGKIDDAVLLKYKNIPKRDRKDIIDRSFEIQKTTGKPQWEVYQELLAQYAINRGYKAVTKPYKALIPDAPKFETIVLEKGVFKANRIEEPSRYGIKEGTGQKIVNIITEKEEIKNIGGISTEKTYGMAYPKKEIPFEIPEKSTKFKTKTMEYQTQAKITSITGIETRASLADEGLTASQIDEIMGPYKFVRAAKGRRYIKETMDAYMGAREAARVSFKAGDRAGALASAKTMVAIQKYYGRGFHFGEQIRKYRPSVELEFKSPEPKLTDRLSSGIRSTRAVSPAAVAITKPASVRSNTNQESPRTSAYSVMPRSTISGRSSFSSRPSPKSSFSASSGRSSFSSRPSPKSSFSASSGRSSFSSRPSPKSTFSASSGRSSFSSRPSPKSASPKSPRSAISPASGGGPSPLSPQPSPISPLVIPVIRPPKPPVPPRPPRRLNMKVKQKTDRQKEPVDKDRADFLGQAFVSQITGFAKRGDITYGRAKTAKLAASDVRLTGKKYPRFGRGKNRNIISKSKPTITKPFKKAKVFNL